jgi:DNA-directed RNA polymerase subunit L
MEQILFKLIYEALDLEVQISNELNNSLLFEIISSDNEVEAIRYTILHQIMETLTRKINLVTWQLARQTNADKNF